MMLLSKLRSLCFGLFRRPQVESSMTDEVSFHIDARAEDLIRTGVSREEAMRQATDEIMCRIAVMLPEKYRGVYADHPRLKELFAEQ